MTDDAKFTIVFIVMGVTAIVGLLFGLYKITSFQMEQQKKEYAECKEKTSDIEWCFENTFGQKLK